MSTRLALAGRRVVVTRARPQAGELRLALEALGAEVVELPVIEIAATAFEVPPLTPFEWVVFTSRNGVEAFVEALRAAEIDVAEVSRRGVAAIGPGTAAALADAGIRPTLVPATFVAEALVEAFPEAPSGGGSSPSPRVLIARASEARDVLPEGLRRKGWELEVLSVYRTVLGRPDDQALAAVRAGAVDALTFTSSSTVRNFLSFVGELPTPQPPAFCIGPITAATATELGISVAAVAPERTIAGLVETVVKVLGSSGGSKGAAFRE
ncbi:MAG: uroporphyrinogen-III synthase [Acidimicrobiia bacterium]